MKFIKILNTPPHLSTGIFCVLLLVGVNQLTLASTLVPILISSTQGQVIKSGIQSKGNLNTLSSKKQVNNICRKIANKLGSVKLRDCKNRGMETTGGYSVGGLPVIVKEYGPILGRVPKAKILLIGGIHGDEFSSVSLVFKWMKILDRHHSGAYHWRMVPVMNPDGLLQKRSQRMNKNGVDLNRNFPTPNWEAESHKYWIKTSKNPRRYPGKAPLSEPESQWLAEYIAEFKPDVIVSIHAPFGILDFDGPRVAPKNFGSLQLNLLGTYPGSLGNYAGINKRIPVITIELPHAGIMPKASEIRNIWGDLVQWIKNHAIGTQPQQRALDDSLKSVSQPALLKTEKFIVDG